MYLFHNNLLIISAVGLSTAAKSIRECKTPVLTYQDAIALQGVGKRIAVCVEEFILTGDIQDMRI